MTLIKDSQMISGRLYVIRVELSNNEVFEVDASENGFQCDKDGTRYSGYTLPGLLS